MRYARIIRTNQEDWITVGEYIEGKQPYTYKKLKLKYPILLRIITDERQFKNIKHLMEEKQGVII